MIPADIVARLRCPRCGEVVAAGEDGVACGAGHDTPLVDGYLDARPDSPDGLTRQTLESFGYEWTTFDTIQPEDRRFWDMYFKDVPLDWLAGAVALDAGCGKGRYTSFLAPHVKALAALDGSAATEAAARNLAEHANVAVVRADLREAPFASRSFDFVCCLGVLHHLADPAAGFRRLIELLAPGGRVLVYLYSRPDRLGPRQIGLAAARWARRLTVRLPHGLLRWLSAPLAGALYVALVLPGAVGRRLGVAPAARLPLATYRGKPVRSLWLDTFDRLSAPVEHRYLWSELEPWFREQGLEVEHVREEAGLFILARRPEEPGATEVSAERTASK